jgi:polyisoprenyl-phosphate glycosyltransferase
MKPIITLVIPLFNEEQIIETLYERTTEALSLITSDFEIICVNDGSTDATLEKLFYYNQKDKRFKVLELSRNFGHQAAYTAGLNYAKGDYVVMMDGDLQDPPELIIDLYKKITVENLDVVFGSRKERHETFIKRNLIIMFHSIFSRMSSVKAPKNVGNFSIMNRSALNAFLNLNEKNRYLPGLRFFIGFKQGFVEYSRPDREVGKEKMNFSKLLKLSLDAIFSFSNLPIKICLYVGILGILFSIIATVIVLVKKLTGDAITGWTSILVSIYFIASVQLLFLGIIGEYIHRIFVESQNRPIYIVREFHE